MQWLRYLSTNCSITNKDLSNEPLIQEVYWVITNVNELVILGNYLHYCFQTKARSSFRGTTSLVRIWTSLVRLWAVYKQWFGDPATQYWIGSDRLSELPQGDCVVRFDFQTTYGTLYYAQYTTIKVGDASTNYTLSIGGYMGNLTDSMAYSNNRMFSTFDMDNNGSIDTNCANGYAGGFWYNSCTQAAINSGPNNYLYWLSTSNPYTNPVFLNVSKVRLLCQCRY